MMIIGKNNSAVQGASAFYLDGILHGTRVRALVDSGSTHNVVNINVARNIGLREERHNPSLSEVEMRYHAVQPL